MNNIITVEFKQGETSASASGLWQWDYGQILRIEGLSLTPEVEIHFSLYSRGYEAERRIGTTVDGITEVAIPDKMMENRICRNNEYTIFAWVYLSDETSGQTEYEIRLGVQTRSRPGDWAPPDKPDFAGEVMGKLSNLSSTKLSATSYAQIGQIFRVQSITEDGNLVLESVDMPSGDVKDVQIDGESIVGENGVAEIPIASNQSFGAVKINGANFCVDITNSPAGYLRLRGWRNEYADVRNVYMAVTANAIDYAVKCAMCDGKGAAWTADEQAMARARMGIVTLTK